MCVIENGCMRMGSCTMFFKQSGGIWGRCGGGTSHETLPRDNERASDNNHIQHFFKKETKLLQEGKV